jgi:hemolysin III
MLKRIDAVVAHGEKFNTLSHFIAAFFAFCGAIVLMSTAISKGDPTRILSCAIYGVTTIGIYIISTLYHGSSGPKKDVLRKLDYIGIYLKIAGNYTPYMILAIGGIQGYTILVSVWLLAGLGILQEVALRSKNRSLSTLIYVIMTALALPVLKNLATAISPVGFALLMTGFLSYAIGFYFFLNDEKIRHGHGIWHLFVIGGSTCQYLCLLIYVV